MGKGHRDNHRARVKRGKAAFDKKAKRRSRDLFMGAWRVQFACSRTENVPMASSIDIEGVATRLHQGRCGATDCRPTKYEKVKR